MFGAYVGGTELRGLWFNMSSILFSAADEPVGFLNSFGDMALAEHADKTLASSTVLTSLDLNIIEHLNFNK